MKVPVWNGGGWGPKQGAEMRPLEADGRQACSVWTGMDFQLNAVNGHAWKIALKAPMGQRVSAKVAGIWEASAACTHIPISLTVLPVAQGK